MAKDGSETADVEDVPINTDSIGEALDSELPDDAEITSGAKLEMHPETQTVILTQYIFDANQVPTDANGQPPAIDKFDAENMVGVEKHTSVLTPEIVGKADEYLEMIGLGMAMSEFISDMGIHPEDIDGVEGMEELFDKSSSSSTSSSTDDFNIDIE